MHEHVHLLPLAIIEALTPRVKIEKPRESAVRLGRDSGAEFRSTSNRLQNGHFLFS